MDGCPGMTRLAGEKGGQVDDGYLNLGSPPPPEMDGDYGDGLLFFFSLVWIRELEFLGWGDDGGFVC